MLVLHEFALNKGETFLDEKDQFFKKEKKKEKKIQIKSIHGLEN